MGIQDPVQFSVQEPAVVYFDIQVWVVRRFFAIEIWMLTPSLDVHPSFQSLRGTDQSTYDNIPL